MFREQALLDWAKRKGLDRTKVAQLYNSPQITVKINQAKTLTQRYDIQVVPAVIVDNSFATDYEHAGTPSRFPVVVDGLSPKPVPSVDGPCHRPTRRARERADARRLVLVVRAAGSLPHKSTAALL